MGRKARLRPNRLPEKLRQVRTALGLSQTEMLSRLGFDIHYSRISEYELGKNEPPLPILLRYAEAAGVCVDVLINDDLELPTKLPAKPKHKP
ncbi:MAG TPA: helix-turn-helix transcriptional regulator [Pyrinomonadaceae bacterium]|nr:helix-turn-helix transcriptional regulator [Pyrinomonadaceae bacterium]